MENILKLKFDYENTVFGRTHYYVGENNKKSNIVIIHEKNFERIMLATETGEPLVDLKVGILVELNNKLYITVDRRGYTILEEVHRMELEYKIIVAMAKEIAELRDGLDAEYGENNPENYDIEKIIAQYKEEAEKEIKERK